VGIPLEVGRLFRTGWAQPAYYFPGALDEVRIFDEELSAAAVAALYVGNAIAAAPPSDVLGFSIEGSLPNPSRGSGLAIAFTLPGAEPARLALFDIAGRRVSERSVGELGAGRHEVNLAAGRRLAPGIYLIKLTQGARSLTRHVSMLE
jgi:hypothetical protein